MYVSFDKDKSKLVFIVNDEGIGIKNEDQDKMFELFSRRTKYKKKNIILSDGN